MVITSPSMDQAHLLPAFWLASIDELLLYAKLSNSNKRKKRSPELGIGDHSSRSGVKSLEFSSKRPEIQEK